MAKVIKACLPWHVMWTEPRSLACRKPEASDPFPKNAKLSLMQNIGKLVVLVGAILIVVGFCLWKLPGLFGWVGRLPGDISVQKGNFSFYFPIVTCILISVVLTLLSWLF